MSTHDYEPLGNRILVEVTKAREKTEGGVVLPISAQKREGKERLRVIAVGEGKTLDDGRVLPIKLMPGEHVLVQDGLPLPVMVPRIDGGPERYIVDMCLVVGVDHRKPPTADA